MIDCFLEPGDGETLPIWTLAEDQSASGQPGLPAAAASWIKATGFEARRHHSLTIPDGDGGLAGVVLGMGPRGAPNFADPWAFAGLPGELPEGGYHFHGPLDDGVATNAMLGWALGGYRFSRYRRPAEPAPGPRLLAPANGDRALVRRAAEATVLVRDLINTPAADMGPAELAAAAKALATRHGGRCGVVTGQALAEGFPAIAAVGQGSTREPCLIDLRWGDPGAPKVTLVGKGVCFDSGGLNLKSATGMALMKKDMGGGAHALGLAGMIMDAGLGVRLRVLVPAAENSPSGRAYRPGDVIATRKGLSVEIGNTDAEGRLVLADALALADEESPELLIDFATLTGAARVALGPDLPAMFSDDDGLAGELAAAGQRLADPLWRLPLWRPYGQGLKSTIADLNNISDSPLGGAITAALFLDRFVADAGAWVHFDVFGWNPKARPGRPVGGEAMALRAVHAVIAKRYPAA